MAADFSADQESRACRSLLLSAERPTAIVFDNDLMAVTALGVAAEFGLAVPHDLSPLAWDDSQPCQLTRPTLVFPTERSTGAALLAQAGPD